MSASSTSSSSIQFLVYSRRLLLHYPSVPAAATPSSATESYAGDSSFDANVVMVLSVLLCALICSLGLNSIIRCALRCSSLVATDIRNTPSARLANTGIKKKALKTFLTLNYSEGLNQLPGLDSECVICLSEFSPGDRVRLLPKCNHGFHVRCIDKWLNSHSSCPTCRHCLIETCHKIAGCSQASSSQPPPPQDTILTITPLEPEAFIPNYRGNS